MLILFFFPFLAYCVLTVVDKEEDVLVVQGGGLVVEGGGLVVEGGGL